MFRSILLVVGFALMSLHLGAAEKQLVVATAPDANSHRGMLRLFTRQANGSWRADGAAWPVLYGKNGMAWGLGLHSPQPGLQKVEKDGRTPSGRFKIGMALGYEPSLPAGSVGWTYHQVTEDDAWIGNGQLPKYNNLVTIKGEKPSWFEKEKMRQGDFAYHWLLLIEHNYPDAVVGAGSAIFFHVRRGEDRASAGCTTMAQPNLEKLLAWLNPNASPELVQLPKADYERLWQEWKLPSPAQVWGDAPAATPVEKKAAAVEASAPVAVPVDARP